MGHIISIGISNEWHSPWQRVVHPTTNGLSFCTILGLVSFQAKRRRAFISALLAAVRPREPKKCGEEKWLRVPFAILNVRDECDLIAVFGIVVYLLFYGATRDSRTILPTTHTTHMRNIINFHRYVNAYWRRTLFVFPIFFWISGFLLRYLLISFSTSHFIAWEHSNVRVCIVTASQRQCQLRNENRFPPFSISIPICLWEWELRTALLRNSYSNRETWIPSAETRRQPYKYPVHGNKLIITE